MFRLLLLLLRGDEMRLNQLFVLHVLERRHMDTVDLHHQQRSSRPRQQ